MTELFFPENGYLFDTQTPIQKEFMNRIHSAGTEQALEWLSTVKNDREQSYPQALQFTWKENGSSPYRFALSEDADFSAPAVYITNKPCLSIDNLKIGTKYYWRVNDSAVRSFQTTETDFRFIRIDGILNVRDVGGKHIRQGLLYRGSALDCFPITEQGKQTFRDELNIKTEIELRKGAAPTVTESVVPGVERIYAPYRPYMEVFEEEHKQGICKIMQIFTDETNYPVYFHCMGGADRTGMIAFYLRAIAEESDDDMHTDYELTALSTYAAGAAEGADGFRSRNAPYYKAFLDELQTYAPGESLSVCAKAFLLSCGVTRNQIEQIKTIIKK